MKPILSVQALSFATPDGKVLGKNIHFRLEPGETLLISGDNGSGKTTMLRVLMGRVKKKSGTLKWEASYSQIGYVPQLQESHFHIPATMSDVVNMGLPHPTTDASIARTGLLSRKHLSLRWNQASGGEKKRALLTRIFLLGPQVLILDEPFNHLDDQSQELVRASLRRFLAARKKALILVSHGFEGIQKLGRVRRIQL